MSKKDKTKTVTAHFDAVDLWLRIKLASSMWWDIVVKKTLDCVDDEEEQNDQK